MPDKIDGVILNEKVSADELVSGVINHGFLFPIVGKSIQDLVDQLNDIKTPYAIKSVVYGENRFNAIIEMDRKIKKIKKIKSKKRG